MLGTGDLLAELKLLTAEIKEMHSTMRQILVAAELQANTLDRVTYAGSFQVRVQK